MANEFETDLHDRLTRLERGFEGFHRDLGAMSAQLEGLSGKIDSALQQSQTPTITLSMAVQVLGLLAAWSMILGGLVYSYLDGVNRAVAVEIAHLQEDMDCLKPHFTASTQSTTRSP